MSLRNWLSANSIWAFAFGYFACYVPYSALTKLLSGGNMLFAEGHAIPGVSVLPISALASAIAMLVFITVAGWWKHATHTRILGFHLPTPNRWTLLSGLCATCTVATTTLAYTFEGVSIVFAMLLMRGGVLILAPIVDAISKRAVRWFAWAALAMALIALLVGVTDTSSYAMPVACAINIAVYLAAYFVRFRFMSKLAKSDDENTNKRYFVEESMVATPALTILLGVYALVGPGDVALAVREGFTAYWGHTAVIVTIAVIGFLSQGTGLFGNLIFLDKRENTFCVPVNRSSSVLAGVVASYLLTLLPNGRALGVSELIGAGLIIGAIVFLTIPPMIEKRRNTRR